MDMPFEPCPRLLSERFLDRLCGQGGEKFVRHFVVSFFLRAGENLRGSNWSGKTRALSGLFCFCSAFFHEHPLFPYSYNNHVILCHFHDTS